MDACAFPTRASDADVNYLLVVVRWRGRLTSRCAAMWGSFDGRVAFRVYLTGGNWSGLTGYRSNRTGPVPVWAGTKPAQIQNLNLNSKK